MKTLIVIPTEIEYEAFLLGCAQQGLALEGAVLGRLPVKHCPALAMVVARGGLGKVQFAVHTQHLLDVHPLWERVVCAGAAGALVDTLAIGDIVVATETVEHDIRNRFGKPLVPRFGGEDATLAELRQAAAGCAGFAVAYGPIASGDEDVVDHERRETLRAQTGAVAVAWEGAGGARACRFSAAPYIELRGVSDRANQHASSDFTANVAVAMQNIAVLITVWLATKRNSRDEQPGPQELAANPHEELLG
jgi:adenosylhomocysteine nucleosidase